MDTTQYFYDSNSKSSPLGMTLKTTGRYPIESWKQWKTLSDLKKFIINTDNDAAAYPGMVVSVVSDTDVNNGVYLIKKVGDNAKDSKGECLDSSFSKLAAMTNLSSNKMKLLKDGESVTTVKADGSTYVLKQGDDEIASFNIVKDSFVKKGELVYKQTDGSYSHVKSDDPYIHLVINVFDFDYDDFTGSDYKGTDNVYIPVKGLIDDLDLYVSNAGDNWKTTAIGGIRDNMTKSDFAGKTVSEMLDAILYPTLSPTITNPSIKIKYNGSVSTLIEVGAKIPVISDFSVETDRGSLSYVNSNGNYYYGGEFGKPTYTINGSSGNGGITSSYGNYVYSVMSVCASGATPLNNKGEVDSSVPAYAGGTLTSSKTFTALYPIYINTSSISIMTKQVLKDYYNNSQIEYYVTIPEEVINGDKFMIELPDILTLYSVKQKNMTNNKYDIDISMVSNGTTTYFGKTYNKYIRTKTSTNAVGQAEYYIVIKKK